MWRVSSAAITSALASASRARALKSARLPIGVATTSSRPRIFATYNPRLTPPDPAAPFSKRILRADERAINRCCWHAR